MMRQRFSGWPVLHNTMMMQPTVETSMMALCDLQHGATSPPTAATIDRCG
jgi:hypothetical protein